MRFVGEPAAARADLASHGPDRERRSPDRVELVSLIDRAAKLSAKR